MRITNNMLSNNMLDYMSNNLNRMSKYQNQLATGKKIQVPSDDPIVALRALKLRTDVSEIEQYQRNASDAQSWTDITETTLSNMSDVLQRTRELVVKGASDSNTIGDRQNICDELKQLKAQMVQISNTTYAGRYVFSGYSTDKPLVNEDGTFAVDVANSEAINYEIGIGDSININVAGGDLLNSGGAAISGQSGQVFKDFDAIISAMGASGNAATISGLIKNVDDDMNNLSRVRSGVGAISNRIEMTMNRLDSDNLNYTKLMSENEDVDMAEAIMNLQSEESVYKASLSGGAKVIQTTLIDFLR